MNMLLYAESKNTLAQLRGHASQMAAVWVEPQDLTLPEELFEELGYTSTIAAPQARRLLFEDLFDWRPAPEPALAG